MEFMHKNFGESVPTSKHHDFGSVLPQHDPFEYRRLNSLFVQQVGALAKYPAPDHFWKNVASNGRLPHKGNMAVVCGKIAMRAAIATGNADTMEETALRIERYFDACKIAATADYHAIGKCEVSLDEATVRASKETTECQHAILVASIQHDASEMTLPQLNAAIQALIDLRERVMVIEATHGRRAALALS